MTYRDIMLEDGGDLDWCCPYESKNGMVSIVYRNTKCVGLFVYGFLVDPTTGKFLPSDALVADDYDETAFKIGAIAAEDERGEWDEEIYSAEEFIRDKCRCSECRYCPMFYECEEMDETYGDDEEDED